MNFKLDKNRPSRTQSLFQKLNKLTNIKYPSTNDRNISNLYDLNEGNLTDRQPKNIFKINYTIIKNEFPKTKMESNTAKLTVFPNILSHKNSLSSPTQRKITDKKKRSLSENRQFSFSNIVENQTSALFNFKINQFDKPKLHSNYFKENSVNLPNREKKENESSSVNLDNVKVADFQTFKEICEDKEIDKKFKTNSFELNQRNIFKKKIIGTNNNLISVEAVKNTKKPNISLEIDVLEEEYDFGLKIKEESNEKTVFIKDKENDQRDTNKYMNSSNKKMFEANENSLTNVPPFKNNLLNKKENQNLHSENFNRSEKEELSRKNREISIMQIDSDRVSFLKARKKNEIITQVKINDYPNDKDPRINTSIIKRVCLNLKIFYQKLIRFLSCKNFFEKIKTQFNNGLIDVLVTCNSYNI